jgi:hypothetical protein
MDHPYQGLPATSYWRTGVSGVVPGLFDPVVATTFTIGRDDSVATLGSCFAQHLARSIRAKGFRYLVAETPPPDSDAQTRASYGVFSARYGNVYTVRQAVQLLERAFDAREFIDTVWRSDGAWHDAFRPTVEPDGFQSVDAVLADRQKHLTAVRHVFTTTDVIVFTLGLTEAWVSRDDGAVYPVAPGVAAGQYDPGCYEFKNFSYPEVRADLESWVSMVRGLRPGVRILLTVSPVPLAATREGRHVWSSTLYSKSTLIAVAQDVAQMTEGIDYFPSYEIVTGPLAEGRYFADDLRTVRDSGVEHVMTVFGAHYLEGAGETSNVAPGASKQHDAVMQLEELSSVMCDEDLLLDDHT